MARGLAVIAVLLLLPGTASAATTRYAAPGKSAAAACTSGDPCEIRHAFSVAGPNDEIVIRTGDYGSPTAPITNAVESAQPGLNVHGEDGQPRPRIFIQTGSGLNGVTAFGITGAGSSVRHLEVVQGDGAGLRTGAFVLDNASATDIVARNKANEGRACIVLHTSTLTDALCEATSDGAKGVATYSNVGPGAANTSVLRNVTAIAQKVGFMESSTAIQAFAGTSAADAQHLTVSNSIARSTPGNADIAIVQQSNSDVGDITVDHSNFGFESSGAPGAPDRVLDGPGGPGANQRNGGVVFAGPGDYHQAAGSVTIDAGATSSLNGPVDFDGDPRVLGDRTDIGADEYVPPPTVVTRPATNVTRDGAVLHGTVDPNTLATTYHFEYGKTNAYGRSTPLKGAGTGNTPLAVSATLKGLTENATYHFRLVGTNQGGTVGGGDLTFKTVLAKLLSLTLAPEEFASAASGGSVQTAATKPPIGTTVKFRLNKAAGVKFGVKRQRPGRRVNGRCVKQTASNRSAPKCKRYVGVKGGFRVAGKGGKNQFKFTGRLAGKALPKGRYRLVGKTAANSLRAAFRIVPR